MLIVRGPLPFLTFAQIQIVTESSNMVGRVWDGFQQARVSLSSNLYWHFSEKDCCCQSVFLFNFYNQYAMMI